MSAKKSRSNKIQLQILVDFMSTHNHLATGEFTGPLGAKRANSQWQNLKSLLKEHGPDRTVEQWKQTWKDIKKCARTDNAAAARGHSSTGNTKIVPIVSDISTKVLNIIGHECSTGVGPEESIIGQADEMLEVAPVQASSEHDIPFFLLPPAPFYTHIDELENIPPASSTIYPAHPISNPAATIGNPAPSTIHLTSTTHTAPIKRERPHDAFNRLQQENNALLQSIDGRLKEQNDLLRDRNQLLRVQNSHSSHRNKLKRMKRFSRRF